MSVLATSDGLNCQAYADCQLPSPYIPSTMINVTLFDCGGTCSFQSASASDPQPDTRVDGPS